MYTLRIANDIIALYDVRGVWAKRNIPCGDIFFVLYVNRENGHCYNSIVMLSDGSVLYTGHDDVRSYSDDY